MPVRCCDRAIADQQHAQTQLPTQMFQARTGTLLLPLTALFKDLS